MTENDSGAVVVERGFVHNPMVSEVGNLGKFNVKEKYPTIKQT